LSSGTGRDRDLRFRIQSDIELQGGPVLVPLRVHTVAPPFHDCCHTVKPALAYTLYLHSYPTHYAHYLFAHHLREVQRSVHSPANSHTHVVK